jgi:hypothetical protein
MDILRIVLAILLPPLAVFMTVGLGLHFWINIGLYPGNDSCPLGYCEKEREIGNQCCIKLSDKLERR